ncbi:actin-like ATPase domain-containing protein [Setomelanomma holmii]|uniref:Actin-like ATPase domain-containing protein n=1 Tax=Setomelanomma holmii TaxID=210430 RepID=A0A9P4H0Z6_9PLEO|nr:actin-like ATPase domain-containing protein [Setomelanomma holmii]
MFTFGTPSTNTAAYTSIIVGIDFGTTFSGVAWAYSKQPEDIEIVTNWDCVDTQNSDKGKAPTRIAYEKASADTTMDNENMAEWFKLLLLEDGDMDEDTKSSAQIQRAKSLLCEAGKTPVEAVADYLRLLWQHAVLNIERNLGEATVDGLPFKIVCTVPAVWNNAAVGKMRKASKSAGLMARRAAGTATLDFVSEPEAAALATFEDLKYRPNLQVGDIYVVCDAGGGTVDLISYKGKQTRPLQLKECVEGSGQLCGAVFLDQDVEAMIAQRLGDTWDVSRSVKNEVMNSQREHGIKRTFEDQDRIWSINLPWPCVMRGAPPSINLERAHVKDLFENIVSKIRRLVDDQVARVEARESKPPKVRIVLVGGFGSCRYIHKVLILQSSGSKPWTAICRGAVLSALQNSQLRLAVVRSRIVRCNYGVQFTTPFDPAVHEERDKYFNERYQKDYADNQMSWYIKRGDNMSVTRPVRKKWFQSLSCDFPQLSFDFDSDIYACRAHEPPTRLDLTVTKSCILQSDSPVDISAIAMVKNQLGKSYKDLEYEIEMKVFVIIFNGREIGRSHLIPEFEV